MLFVICHYGGASNYTAFISDPGDTAQRRSQTAAGNTCEAGTQQQELEFVCALFQGTKFGLSSSDSFGLLGEISRLLIVRGHAPRAHRSKGGRSIICSENWVSTSNPVWSQRKSDLKTLSLFSILLGHWSVKYFLVFSYVKLSQGLCGKELVQHRGWACTGHPQESHCLRCALPQWLLLLFLLHCSPTCQYYRLSFPTVILIDFARLFPLFPPSFQPVRAGFARGKFPLRAHRATAVVHSEVARKDQPVPVSGAQDTHCTQVTSPWLFHQHLSPINTFLFLTELLGSPRWIFQCWIQFCFRKPLLL